MKNITLFDCESAERVTLVASEASDGYHTFDELYEHRIALWIALCAALSDRYRRCDYDGPWRSKLHSDGSCFDGWFVLGFGVRPGEQITYHLPMSRWDDCDFAEILDHAPEFDGHTPSDVLERLRTL